MDSEEAPFEMAAGSEFDFVPASGSKPNAKASEVSSTSFAPPSLKSKPSSSSTAAARSAFSLVPPKPAAPAVDFFSLGGLFVYYLILFRSDLSTVSSGPHIYPASTSASSPSAPSKSIVAAPSTTISSAPSVVEFQPPSPSINDPYPGYYQKPSGDWAAYDPEFYQSFWANWNKEAAGKGKNVKRKEREWDGAEDEEGLEDVNMREEMLKSQIAQREATKNITTAPEGPAAKPNMNIKVCCRFVLGSQSCVSYCYDLTGKVNRGREAERTALCAPCRSVREQRGNRTASFGGEKESERGRPQVW